MHSGEYYLKKFIKLQENPTDVIFHTPGYYSNELLVRFFEYLLYVGFEKNKTVYGYKIDEKEYQSLHNLKSEQAKEEFEIGKKIFIEGINKEEAGLLMGIKLFYSPTVDLEIKWDDGSNSRGHIILGTTYANGKIYINNMRSDLFISRTEDCKKIEDAIKNQKPVDKIFFFAGDSNDTERENP